MFGNELGMCVGAYSSVGRAGSSPAAARSKTGSSVVGLSSGSSFA